VDRKEVTTQTNENVFQPPYSTLDKSDGAESATLTAPPLQNLALVHLHTADVALVFWHQLINYYFTHPFTRDGN
jgi:hypothetical protein